MMIFRTILMIIFLATLVYSDSFESDESIDCDSFFIESEDSLLPRFIMRHNLQYYFMKRNENFETCMEFLNKFTAIIYKYRNEEGKQDDFKISKKAIRKKPNSRVKPKG
jgi:hypothetical protein